MKCILFQAITNYYIITVG